MAERIWMDGAIEKYFNVSVDFKLNHRKDEKERREMANDVLAKIYFSIITSRVLI